MQCTDECKQAGNCSGAQSGDCDGLDTYGDQKKWCRICRCVVPEGACVATAPTGLSASDVAEGQANLTWTAGTGGATQRFYLDNSASDVEANCPSGSCLISNESLSSSTASQSISGLNRNTTYYWKVVTYDADDCQASTNSNFDHWQVSDSWYQVQGGNLHADGGGVYSDIPSSCVDDASCDAYLITNDINGEAGAVTNIITSLFACNDQPSPNQQSPKQK